MHARFSLGFRMVCLILICTFFVPPVPINAASGNVTATSVPSVPNVGGCPVNIGANGPTNFSGNITQNTTWSAANSPYIIQSNVTIASNATLNIQAGTVIKFNGDFELRADGTLNAVGAQSCRVRFTSNQPNPARGDWRQVRLSNRSRVEFTQIDFSKNGFLVTGASPIIKNNLITANLVGLDLSQNVLSNITQNSIHSNGIGIRLNAGSQSGTFNRNAIFNNDNSYNFSVTGGPASLTIDAQENWWGTTNITTINAKIFDQRDNTNLPLVDFRPYLDGLNGNPIDPNHPPVLNAVGSQIMELGTSLQLQLSASDPDFDPLTFIASPLPLPANMSLNGMTGEFRFTPDATQTGVIDLTFRVSDGLLTDDEAIQIQVNGSAGGPTQIHGRVMDSNTMTPGGSGRIPLRGVVVSLLGDTTQAVSDGQGFFTLTTTLSGNQVLDFNTTNAVGAVGETYAGFREEYPVIAGVVNEIARPVYLPRLDLSSATVINPNQNTLVRNPNINVEVNVTAGSAIMNGQPFSGMMTISEVPQGFEPAQMPSFLDPALLITLQPVGVTYNTPVPITFPNLDNMPAGSLMDLWSLDAGTGQFVIVGQLQVDPTGTRVETVSGGIRANDWHAIEPPGLNGGPSFGDGGPCPGCCSIPVGSEVKVDSGAMLEDHTTVAYRSMGEEQSLKFVYNSLNADPRPVIGVNAVIPSTSAVPNRTSIQLSVGGVQVSPEIFTNTSGLNENLDEPIHLAAQFDATNFPTGRYQYVANFKNYFNLSSIGSSTIENIHINNQTQSIFGSGWELNGLQRIIEQPNNILNLLEGDGEIKSFFANGYALKFDGSNDFVRFGSGPNDYAHTVEAWVNVYDGQTASFPAIFGRIDIIPFCTEGWGLRLQGNTYRYVVDIDGCNNGWDLSQFPILPFEWHHMAGTFDGNTMKFYFDGNFVGQRNNVSFDFADNTTAGAVREQNGYSGFFKGEIDEIRFWNYAKTGNEIRSTMNTALTGNEQGLRGYWNFNEGTGQIAEDLSINNYQGVLGSANGIDASDPKWIPSNAPVTLIQGNGPTTFISPAGDYSDLVKNANDTFTRTMKDGTVYQFDVGGLLTERIDRNGNTTRYAYYPNGNLRAILDPVNKATLFTYDNAGYTVTDPAGRATRFNIDANGNLVEIIDPDGTRRQFTYDAHHRMTTQTTKRGFTSQYFYDALGRNNRVIRADGSTRSMFAAQTVGLLAVPAGAGTQNNPGPVVRPTAVISTFTNGNNQPTSYVTDTFGASTSIVDAIGRVTTIMRDDNANPTQIIRPNTAVTDMTYDTKGNVLTVRENAINALTTYTYTQDFNQIDTIVDAENHLTNMNYDAFGNPIEIIDDAGTITKMEYTDPACPGAVTKIIAAFGLPEQNETRFEYFQSDCNLQKTIDPLLRETSFTYVPNSSGNVKTVTDAQGKVTEFFYDALNRLVQVKDADLKDTFYTYDAAGNLVSVRDANNQLTQFTYDQVNRLKTTIDPLGKVETYNYDANGNLDNLTDRKNQLIDFQYDPVDRLIRKILPGNSVTDYTYDVTDNLDTIADGDSVLNFDYDLADRLERVNTTGSPLQPDVILEYDYDKLGNRLVMREQIAGSAMQSTSYVFDNLGQIDTITNPSGLLVNINHDALNRRSLMSYPNSTTTTYQYDVASQLKRITHALIGFTFSDFDYAVYDNAGNRQQINVNRTSVANLSAQLNYVYDNVYRLEDATAVQAGNPNETFDYDAVGNRLRQTGQAVNSQFDQANRLINDTRFTYQYDDNGNMTSKTAIASGQTTIYIYDAENQLIRINFPGGTSAEYKYDGLGRRIQKNVHGVKTTYVYDSEDILFEFNNANTLAARYTHGVGIDEPLVMQRDINLSGAFEATEAFYYHTDGLGSITELTDNQGATAQSYLYDSFGTITTQIGSLTNPFTYTGREFDAESDLYYYRARYYDSRIGRFLQEDPLNFAAGGFNFYLYVFNDPINYKDPLGLFTLKESFDAWWNEFYPTIETLVSITIFKKIPFNKNPFCRIGEGLYKGKKFLRISIGGKKGEKFKIIFPNKNNGYKFEIVFPRKN